MWTQEEMQPHSGCSDRSCEWEKISQGNYLKLLKLVLNHNELHGRRPRKEKAPTMADKNTKTQTVRQKLVKQRVDKHSSLWEKVSGTSETKVKLFGSSHRFYFFWKGPNKLICLSVHRMSQGEVFKPKNIVPTAKHGGGSSMLWSSFYEAI